MGMFCDLVSCGGVEKRSATRAVFTGSVFVSEVGWDSGVAGWELEPVVLLLWDFAGAGDVEKGSEINVVFGGKVAVLKTCKVVGGDVSIPKTGVVFAGNVGLGREFGELDVRSAGCAVLVRALDA